MKIKAAVCVITACIHITFVLSGCTIEKQANELYQNPERYPAVIDSVYPAPGAVSSLSSGVRYASDLCVSIDVYHLLEPGDTINVVQGVELHLDGKVVTDPEPYHTTILVRIYKFGEDSPQAQGPEIDTVCWEGVLSTGIHVAKFQVWTTSGVKYEYEWAYKVIE